MRSFQSDNSSLNNVVIAPFWRRVLAGGIDTMLILSIAVIEMLLGLTVYSTINFLQGSEFVEGYQFNDLGETGAWIINTALWLTYLLYHVFFLRSRHGRTAGKSIMQIRVLSKTNDDLSPLNVWVRTVLMPISAIPALLGYLLFFRSRKNSSLHDWIAGTIVLREEVEHEIIRDPAVHASL